MKYLLRATCITLGTLAMAFLLGCFGALLDRMDHSNEWAESQSLIDAQIAAYDLAKKEKAGQDLCLATVGESLASWNEDGDLICVPKGLRKK